MADYFIEKYNNNDHSQSFPVFMESVGNKANENGEYPVAYMGARVYPSQASANFDFTRIKLSHLNEHQLAVSKETGLNPKLLSGEMDNRFKDAVQARQYSAKHEPLQNDYRDRYYRRENGIRYAKAISALKKGSTELFTTTPQSVHISEAFSHSKMRHAIPIMGSYLNQKFGNVEISSSLSPYSAPLVRNLKNKGYNVKVENDEEPEVSNDMQFDDDTNVVEPTKRNEMLNSPTRLSKQEIASAKAHFKSLRRGERSEPKSLGPQFEQLKFPGMDAQ